MDMFEQKYNKTPSTLYVQNAQGSLRKLKKENFKLKLRMYYLEHGWNDEMPNLEHILEKSEFRGIFANYLEDNEQLRAEIDDKIETLKEVSACIDSLEKKRSEDDLAFASEILEWRNQVIEQKKKSSMHLNSRHALISPTIQKKIVMLKSQNNFIRRLLKEKKQIAIVYRENENLQSAMSNAKFIHSKLSLRSQHLEQLAIEQNEMIKSLNKTIDHVKGDSSDFKSKLEFDSRASFDEVINLKKKKSETKCRLPMHNPIFGSIESLI